MNEAEMDQRPWSRSRWLFFTALIFAAQIGVIFAFGERRAIGRREVSSRPALQLTTGDIGLLALDNPTLFALPNREGFSGQAWLQTPEVPFQPFEWNEPARWLPLPVGRLGVVLSQFMQTNVFPSFAMEAKPPPKLNLPKEADTMVDITTPSILRVEGDLAQRRLAGSPYLPPWPAADLLPDSKVLVYVDDAGNVVTTALLPPGSGLKDADQKALDLARMIRFVPTATKTESKTHWTRGTLVFQWHAIPQSTTNAPWANH